MSLKGMAPGINTAFSPLAACATVPVPSSKKIAAIAAISRLYQLTISSPPIAFGVA